VAGKDDEHARIAGTRVSHTTRVVDGRTGYVWTHESGGGYWHHVVWFPGPVHSIRLECMANKEVARFKRLCAEAVASLRLHPQATPAGARDPADALRANAAAAADAGAPGHGPR
jgi:hypothetical protein